MSSSQLLCPTDRQYLQTGERKPGIEKARSPAPGHTATGTAELGPQARPIPFHWKYLASMPRADANNATSTAACFPCITLAVLTQEVTGAPGTTHSAPSRENRQPSARMIGPGVSAAEVAKGLAHGDSAEKSLN